MSWKLCSETDGDCFYSPALYGPAPSRKAPAAACGKETEFWAAFEELHPQIEGEEQEDKTVLGREVLLRQLLHGAAVDC